MQHKEDAIAVSNPTPAILLFAFIPTLLLILLEEV
jgi:hypothetical protein